MTEQTKDQAPAKGDKSRHILPTASTMIGISTTLIGLVKILEHHAGPSQVDVYAGVVAVLFLFSAVLSYISTRLEQRVTISGLCEQVADNFFLIGLIGITGVALFFAYEVI